jgi:hypothetical protein
MSRPRARSKPKTQRTLIHGLYAKVVTKEDAEEIAKIQPTDIEGEIGYLRVMILRLANIVEANGLQAGAKKLLSERAMHVLHVMDLKLNTLLRYVRTQAYLSGEPSEYDRQIEEGEFLARKSRNVFNYLSEGTAASESDGSSGMGDVGPGAVYPVDRGSEAAAVPESADQENL